MREIAILLKTVTLEMRIHFIRLQHQDFYDTCAIGATDLFSKHFFSSLLTGHIMLELHLRLWRQRERIEARD